MDIRVGGAFVTLGLQTGAFDSALAANRRKFQSHATGLQGIASKAANGLMAPFAGVARQIGNLWQNSLVIGGAGAAAAFTGTIKAAADLETQLGAIRKTTGFSTEQMAGLKQQLLGIATSGKMAGASLDDVMSVAEMAGRLGIATKGGSEGLERFVKDMLKVKVALPDVPIEEAASAFAQILNVMGKGSEDAIRLASALNKMDDSSTASARDLLDVAQRFKGVAGMAQLTIPQVLAFATVLKDAGMENEVAGSAISQLFTKMFTNYKKFASIAGMAPDPFRNLLAHDPIKALGVVIAKIKGMKDTVAQLQAIKGLGFEGIRTGGAMQQLLSTFDQLPGRIAVANKEWETMASIDAEVAIKTKEFWSQLTLLWNKVRLAAASIGERLLPMVKSLASGFGSLADDMKGYLEKNGAVIDVWAGKLTRAFRWISVAWSQWPKVVELATWVVEEKLVQLGEVSRRVGVAIGENIGWSLRSAFSIMQSMARPLLDFLTDLVGQVADRLTVLLSNAVGDAARMIQAKLGAASKLIPGLDEAAAVPRLDPEKAAPIRPDVAGLQKAMAKAVEALPPAPGFDFAAMLKQLPNRQAQIKPIMADLDAAVAHREATADARERADGDKDKAAMRRQKAIRIANAAMATLPKPRPADPAVARRRARWERAKAIRRKANAPIHAGIDFRIKPGMKFPMGVMPGDRIGAAIGDTIGDRIGRALAMPEKDKAADDQKLAKAIGQQVAQALGGVNLVAELRRDANPPARWA